MGIVTSSRIFEAWGRRAVGEQPGGGAGVVGGPNPNGRPSSDVVHPWFNGLDLTCRSRDMWIVDFGADRAHDEPCCTRGALHTRLLALNQARSSA